MTEFTLIVPYYRNPLMLVRQINEWIHYPEGVKIICVDDGSPEPAWPIMSEAGPLYFWGNRLQLYRIGVDIPWNRGGARNLGAHVAETEWILHADIDHVLPADAALALLDFQPSPKHWYRFPRFRKGKADETRKKDKVPDDCEYGEIHPHVDSYLVRRDVYWQVGGYDEDFSGCLGGGNMFLHLLEKHQPSELLTTPIRLEVYTRSEIADASDCTLSRDKEEYTRRRRDWIKRGCPKAKNPLRFPWTREL